MNKNKSGNKKILLFCCLLFLLLVSCAGGPPKIPEARQKEYDLNRQGNRAFMKGDYASALGCYSGAARLAKSIENHEGAAVNLIDMAVTYARMEEIENAHKCLDEILDGGKKIYSNESLSQAGYQKALLYLDPVDGGGAQPGAYANADLWAEKALSWCGNGCDAEGRILNLKARITLAVKDPGTAFKYAQKALIFNRKNKDAVEGANSLRLEAEAGAMSGSYVEAARLYGLALAADKDLGLGRKMSYDLLGMGNVFCAMREPDKGKNYLDRALAITEAMDAKETGKEISASIKKCGK